MQRHATNANYTFVDWFGPPPNSKVSKGNGPRLFGDSKYCNLTQLFITALALKSARMIGQWEKLPNTWEGFFGFNFDRYIDSEAILAPNVQGGQAAQPSPNGSG